MRKVNEASQLYEREAESLAGEYGKLQLHTELDRLRVLDLQRQENQQQLTEEWAQLERERRTDAWMRDLNEKNPCKKYFLEEKICFLKTKLQELKIAEQ